MPPMGQPFIAKKRTPEEVIELLMNSRDESIRLRAADAFLKRQEAQRACPTCVAGREEDRARENAIHRLTYAQRTRLRELLVELTSIRDAASTQPTTWDTGRQCFVDEPDHHVVEVRHEPTPVATTPAPVASVHGDEESQQVEQPEPHYSPDPNRYEEVGLIVDDGLVTHALGDEHAQAILDGRITFEEARAQQEAVVQRLKRMPVN